MGPGVFDPIGNSQQHLSISKLSYYNQRPPYFTNEIIELIKDKDTVLRLARKNNDNEYLVRVYYCTNMYWS